MFSHFLCLFILWPALILRFGLFSSQPRTIAAPHATGRQWGLVQQIAGRFIAVRVQVLIVRGAL